MPGSDRQGGAEVAKTPSMLDLVRLSPRLLFPPGGRELYRQIAVLADLEEGCEILVAGSGNGVTLDYFVTEHGAHGAGVDFDEAMVAQATERARERDVADRLQFQHAPLDRLPYRDEVFDVTVGELGLTAHAEPEPAVEELVRVTRPGGTVALVQLAWKAPVDETRRRLLAGYLGVRPLMLVEWKRLLLEAGLERIHIEDWTDEQTSFRPRVAKPFPDFAELFSLREKIGILRRAWRKWGWPGVKTALAREREVHELLTEERILGLHLLKGVKAGSAQHDVATTESGERSAPTGEGGAEESGREPPAEADSAPSERRPEPHHETGGLPLFGPENADD